MFRQTATIALVTLALWAVGLMVLELVSNDLGDIDEVTANVHRGLYSTGSSVASVYQDSSGRFTIYFRTPQRAGDQSTGIISASYTAQPSLIPSIGRRDAAGGNGRAQQQTRP